MHACMQSVQKITNFMLNRQIWPILTHLSSFLWGNKLGRKKIFFEENTPMSPMAPRGSLSTSPLFLKHCGIGHLKN